MIDRISSKDVNMYGSEIYGPETLEYSTPESRELTFAGQVAKEFDLLHIDLSMPGGSNTHIRETAIEWIAEQGNRPRTTLFLIGWTTFSRHYFYYDKPDTEDCDELGKIYHWAQGCNPESASETIGHDVTNLFKHFQLYMTNDLYARKQRMADTIALASVFEKFKYPYVMLNSCSEWLDADLQTDNHPVVGSKYKLMFPWNNFYQPYDSFVSSMIKIYPDNFSPHLHGDKIPHKNYSNGLAEFVRKLYFEEQQ